MSNQEKLLAALAKLDVNNDEHWTSAGTPRMDIVESFVGYNATRAEITEVAPEFSRESPNLPENHSNGGGLSNPSENGKGANGSTSGKAPESEDSKNADIDVLKTELADAQKVLDDAKKVYNDKLKKLDDAISVKEKEEANQKQADTVKLFQKSQQAAREKRVVNAEKIAKMIAETNGAV